MGEETTATKEPTLFGAIRNLNSVTTEINIKLFGKEAEAEEEKEVAAENSITKARDRIMYCVEKLRKTNRALTKLDRK